MNKFKFLGKIVLSDVRTLCGVTHKIQLSDVIIFLHLIVFSIVLLFLLRMVLQAYSVVITKLYR